MQLINELKIQQQVRLEIIRAVDYIEKNNIIRINKSNFISKYFNKKTIAQKNEINNKEIEFFVNYFDILGCYYSYSRSFNYLHSGMFQKYLKESIDRLKEIKHLDFINYIPEDIMEIINSTYTKDEIFIKNNEIKKINEKIYLENKQESFIHFLKFLIGKQIGCINRCLKNEDLKNKIENLIFLSERTLYLMDFIESNNYEEILKNYKEFYSNEISLIDKNDEKRLTNSLSLINGYYNFYDIHNRINIEHEENKKGLL